MTELMPLRTSYCIKKLLAGALLMIAAQGVLSEFASAQGLLSRIRARIEARMASPLPPPPGLPVPPFALRPPAAGLPAGGAIDRQSPRYRSPTTASAFSQQSPPTQRRMLATPIPPQRAAPPYQLAKPPIDESSIISSPIEQPEYEAASQTARPHRSPNNDPTFARARASLGITARDASPQRGVIVVEVKKGLAGERGGIQVNDRIVSAAGRLIRHTSGLIRELALRQPGDSIMLGIVRDDTMRELAVEMGDREGRPIREATGAAASAAKQRAPTGEQSARENTATSEGSLLNGVGSALGSFFSGGQSQPADSTKNTDDVGDGQADQVFELPAPAAEPDSQASDPLALPEDE